MANMTGIGSSPLLPTLVQQNDRAANIRNNSDISTGKGIASTGPDKAALSSAGGVLAKAISTPDSDDVRTAKVAQISAAIASGTYQVPAGAVADKLIQHLLG